MDKWIRTFSKCVVSKEHFSRKLLWSNLISFNRYFSKVRNLFLSQTKVSIYFIFFPTGKARFKIVYTSASDFCSSFTSDIYLQMLPKRFPWNLAWIYFLILLKKQFICIFWLHFKQFFQSFYLRRHFAFI